MLIMTPRVREGIEKLRQGGASEEEIKEFKRRREVEQRERSREELMAMGEWSEFDELGIKSLKGEL